jgi:hypothetical protein
MRNGGIPDAVARRDRNAEGMNRSRRGTPVLILVTILISAGCGDAVHLPQSHPTVTDSAIVSRAASLGYRRSVTCRPDGDQYTCREHPGTCGLDPDHGPMDGSVANAGCWQIVCQVELGVTASHNGETGVTDFYYCERTVAGCADMTAACPDWPVCIAGHGRKLAVDYMRTGQLPGNAGSEFSCPYGDEE